MMVTESRTDADIKCRVLVVAPDREEGRKIKQCLNTGCRFEDVIISDEATARTNVNFLRPGLILLAIRGDERRSLMLNRLRHINEAPIVIWSESGADEAMVRALEDGADEYVSAPLQPAELAARLRAVLRRCRGWSTAREQQSILRAGELVIRLKDRRVFRRGAPVDLTPIEFRLLLALVRRPGELVSHSQLLEEVWGPQYADCPHYVRLYVRYLRVKIEDDPHAPRSLISEWGMGYRFEPGGNSIAGRTDFMVGGAGLEPATSCV